MEKSKEHIVPCGSKPTAQPRQAVLLFARAPLNEARSKRIGNLEIAGRLKLFKALTRNAITNALDSGAELVVATDAKVSIFRDGAAHLLRQRGVGFGERLLNALHDTFALGYHQVAVIGNDSPELDGKAIRTVLTNRPTGSLTLCRAADGGVTLIALDHTTADLLPTLFFQLRWKTSSLFDDFAATARAYGIPVDDREGGSDLDTVPDLIRLAGCAAAPHALRELASLLLPTRSSQSFIPYVRPLRRTLCLCRQKSPPIRFFSPAL